MDYYLHRGELDDYRRKRDPKRTPEPFGGSKRGSRPIFVVQRHDARRLHYDFRLERNGALASWAVPKGVPLSPGERVLAVHVEDHPLDYASFAGEIPQGEYGAGTVEIWDRGTYELVEEKRDGQLTVRLHGERLHGVWTLVPGAYGRQGAELAPDPQARASGGGGGAGARATARCSRRRRDALPRGRGLAVRGEVGRLPRDRVRPRRRVPARLAERQRPDAALRAGRAGGRQGAEDAERRARRRGVRARRARPAELLARCRQGRARSSTTRSTCSRPTASRSSTLPLRERQRAARGAARPAQPRRCRLSEAFDDGEALLAAAEEQGLEGVMAKRPDSKYRPGRRTRDWLKVKTHGRAGVRDRRLHARRGPARGRASARSCWP